MGEEGPTGVDGLTGDKGEVVRASYMCNILQ